MNGFKTVLVVILIAVIAVACAVIPQYQLTPVDESPDLNINLVDSRDAKSKTTETLSRWITSCKYGIDRLGDDKLNFNRISYFSRLLLQTPGVELEGKTIEFKVFNIYKNTQAILRHGVYGANRGLVSSVMGKSSCHATKDMPGGYDPEENPKGSNVLALNIEVLVDAVQYEIREIQDVSDVGVMHSSRPDLWEEGLNKIFRKAAKSLVSQMRNQKPGS